MTTKVNENKDLCPKPPAHFVRDATGLVRELSLADSTYMGLAVVGVLIGVPFVYTAIYGLFPTADFAATATVGFLAALPIGTVCAMLSAAMPRAGGDYVWTSRALGPIVGFANNLAWFVGLVAVSSSFITYEFSFFFLSSTFAVEGAVLSSPSIISIGNMMGTPTVSFIIGTIVLLVMFVVNALGMRIARRVQAVLAIIMIIGTFAVIYLFASTPNQLFITQFNNYRSTLGSTYQDVITGAQRAGWTLSLPTLAGSITPLVFSIGLYNGFQYQMYVGGEVKQASRNLPLSMYLALVIGAVWWIGLSYVFLSPLGSQFFQAATYLYMTNSTAYSAILSQPPTPILFINIMSASNPLLYWLIFLGFASSYLVVVLAFYLIFARMTFAWSFEHMIPAWFSNVNEKFHTPINSLIFIFVINEAFLAVYAYASWLFALANWIIIFSFVYVVWGITALIFPYRRKSMFEAAPRFSRSMLFGVPIMSIAGLITMILGIFSIYFDIATPAFSGLTAPIYLAFTPVPYVVAVAIYFASKYYHMKKGIDISLASKEIPPE